MKLKFIQKYNLFFFILMVFSLSLMTGQAKAASFVVNMTTDANDANTGDGVCDSNLASAGLQCTLRAAIQQSNVSVGSDDITFSLGGANEINLTLNPLEVYGNLTITGPGARLLTVQRAAGVPAFGIFYILATGYTVNISGITIANGSSTVGGGGIRNNSTALNLTDVTVKNNISTSAGGGITSFGTLNILRSTFSNNTGIQGGAVNHQSGTANISNSTFSNNTATNVGASPNSIGLGGAIINYEAMILNNVTISNNTATSTAGGIYDATVQPHYVRNTIIADNTAPFNPDMEGSVTSLGNNLIGISDGSNGFTNDVNGDKVGTAAAPVKAKLGALQNNGGQTDTRALLPGSPAIDAGNNCVVGLTCGTGNPLQSLTTDQRGAGFSRQSDGDGNGTLVVDIGAFEVQQGQPFTGTESDVASRAYGDGVIQSDDVTQTQRFQIGLDRPFQSNECQRADSAPRNTLGDGVVDSADVTQAQRYQIGLDSVTTAGGPACADSQIKPAYLSGEESDEELIKISGENFDSSAIESAFGAGRVLRVENATGSAGQPVTVNIRADAQGDESAYQFVLTYNSSILQNPTVTIGSAGGSRLCNTTVPGIINCSINNFQGNNPASSTDQIGEIATGSNLQLVTITFTVAANAPPGTTPLNFTNVNASDDAAQPLTIASQSGTMTVLAPTAASAELSGRVITEKGKGIMNAQITLTNSKGQTRHTRSNSFGYFNFTDVASGETYIVTISAKQYKFEPKAINVGESLYDLDFIGLPGKSIY